MNKFGRALQKRYSIEKLYLCRLNMKLVSSANDNSIVFSRHHTDKILYGKCPEKSLIDPANEREYQYDKTFEVSTYGNLCYDIATPLSETLADLDEKKYARKKSLSLHEIIQISKLLDLKEIF